MLGGAETLLARKACCCCGGCASGAAGEAEAEEAASLAGGLIVIFWPLSILISSTVVTTSQMMYAGSAQKRTIVYSYLCVCAQQEGREGRGCEWDVCAAGGGGTRVCEWRMAMLLVAAVLGCCAWLLRRCCAGVFCVPPIAAQLQAKKGEDEARE